MCAEVETDAIYLAYWVCCTGPNMSHEDLYIHALQNPDNLVYCHKALRRYQRGILSPILYPREET